MVPLSMQIGRMVWHLEGSGTGRPHCAGARRYVACLKCRRDLRTVREFFRVAGQFAKPIFTVA
jgi:hypothetical protein